MTAKKKKTEGLPQGLRFNVFRRDNFTCRYCGRSSPTVTLHCDHAYPRSKGGTDEIGNLITACSDCNYGKVAKVVEAIPALPDESLVGLYGHELVDEQHIQRQFRIVRRFEDRHIVQMYSFADGGPMELKPYLTEFLLSSNCCLHLTIAEWRDEADKQAERDAELVRARLPVWFSDKHDDDLTIN